MSVTIKEMNTDDCFDMLRHAKTGILACSHENKPYLVPISFACEERKIYAFSLEGKKIDWMRANPHVCVLVHEHTSRGSWRSVIASGRFEEFPDKDALPVNVSTPGVFCRRRAGGGSLARSPLKMGRRQSHTSRFSLEFGLKRFRAGTVSRRFEMNRTRSHESFGSSQ